MLATRFRLTDPALLPIAEIVHDVTARKSAEEQARASEERLRFALEAGRAVAWEWDPSTGEVQEVGPVSVVFGQPDGVRHADRAAFLERVHPQDRERVLAALEQALHGGADDIEFRVVTFDGKVRWLSAVARVTRGPDGQPARLFGVTRDITALKETEAHWQFGLECASQGVWDWDAVNNRVFYSKEWKAMLGYADHEIGDSLSEWYGRVHPDDSDAAAAAVAAHLFGTTPEYRSKHRLRCKDGSYRWILDQGRG